MWSCPRTIQLSSWALGHIWLESWTNYALFLQFQEGWHRFLRIIWHNLVYLIYKVISKKDLVWLLSWKSFVRSTLRSPINETWPKSIKLFWLRISSQILIQTLSFAWWIVSSLNFVYKRLDCVQFVKVRPHTLSNTVLLSGVFVQESIYFWKSDSFLRLGSLEAFSVRKPAHYRKLHILKDHNCFFGFELRLNALNLRNFSKLGIFGWTF